MSLCELVAWGWRNDPYAPGAIFSGFVLLGALWVMLP